MIAWQPHGTRRCGVHVPYSIFCNTLRGLSGLCLLLQRKFCLGFPYRPRHSGARLLCQPWQCWASGPGSGSKQLGCTQYLNASYPLWKPLRESSSCLMPIQISLGGFRLAPTLTCRRRCRAGVYLTGPSSRRIFRTYTSLTPTTYSSVTPSVEVAIHSP